MTNGSLVMYYIFIKSTESKYTKLKIVCPVESIADRIRTKTAESITTTN